MPHRPISQLERELQSLKYSQNPQALPRMEPLEKAFNLAASRLTVEPGNISFKVQAHEAHEALKAAQKVWQEHLEQNTRIRQLQQELDEASHAKRAELILAADEQLDAAISTYRHACLTAARALRELLNAQHRSGQVPGASNNLQSMRLHLFNLPSLMPMSWNGTLGESMMKSAMPFEQPAPTQQTYPDLKRVA